MWDWLRGLTGRGYYTDGESDYVAMMQEQQAYDLSRYPWLGEFDIASEDDQNKIRRIRELLNQGQGFRIYKANNFGTDYGRGSKPLAQIGFFPTADDVWDLVGTDWGGGTYNITSQGRQWILHSYAYDEPSKQPKKRQDANTDPAQDMKSRLIESGLKTLENDPEAYGVLLMGILGKEFGVTMPKKAGKESLDEELIRELAEEDPEFKRELTEKAVAAKYGGRKEKDTLAEFLKVKKQLDELGIGKSLENKTSWTDMVGGVVKEGLSVLRDPGVRDSVTRVVEAASNPQQQRPNTTLPPQITIDNQNAPPLRIAEPHMNGNQAGVQPAAQQSPQPIPTVNNPTATIQNMGWTDEQWMALMMEIDLAALSTAVDNDAEAFIQGLYKLAAEEEHPAAIQLITLLRDTSPIALHAQICNETLPSIMREDWKGKITIFLGEEAYTNAVGLLEKLSTEQGRKWLELANATCRFLDTRIANKSGGQIGGVGQDTQQTQEAQPVEAIGTRQGMIQGGEVGSTDDGDDGPLI